MVSEFDIVSGPSIRPERDPEFCEKVARLPQGFTVTGRQGRHDALSRQSLRQNSIKLLISGERSAHELCL